MVSGENPLVASDRRRYIQYFTIQSRRALLFCFLSVPFGSLEGTGLIKVSPHWWINAVCNGRLLIVSHLIADKPDPLFNCSVSHQSSESLQIACNEGFSGGLPQNFLLEIFESSSSANGGDDDGPVEPLTNQTAMKPVFIVRGLHADTSYIAHVTAVNAKGRSEPLLVRIVTLRPPETQKNIGPGKSESECPQSPLLTRLSCLECFGQAACFINWLIRQNSRFLTFAKVGILRVVARRIFSFPWTVL